MRFFKICKYYDNYRNILDLSWKNTQSYISQKNDGCQNISKPNLFSSYTILLYINAPPPLHLSDSRIPKKKEMF